MSRNLGNRRYLRFFSKRVRLILRRWLTILLTMHETPSGLRTIDGFYIYIYITNSSASDLIYYIGVLPCVVGSLVALSGDLSTKCLHFSTDWPRSIDQHNVPNYEEIVRPYPHYIAFRVAEDSL